MCRSSVVYIHIHTDRMNSGASRDLGLENQIRQRLARFESRIRDVEVHVEGTDGARAGSDLRCTLEAHLDGVPPIAVAEHGRSLDRAILGAAKKAVRALDDQLGEGNPH